MIKNLIHLLNYNSLHTFLSKVHYVIDNNMVCPNKLMLEVSDEIFSQGFIDKWPKNQFTKLNQEQVIHLINKSEILNNKNKKFNSSDYSLFRGQMMRALFLSPSYEIYKCLEENGFFNTDIYNPHQQNNPTLLNHTHKSILQDDLFIMNIFLSSVDEEYQNTNWIGSLKEENELKESERLHIVNNLIPLFNNHTKILDEHTQNTKETYYKPSFFSPLILKMMDKTILKKNQATTKKQKKVFYESRIFKINKRL